MRRILRATLLFAACARPPAAADELPRITAIEIRPGNVFTKAEADKSFIPYGLANAIHFVTRDSLIRKQLLFAVGDPLDLERLAETERNLRASGLFRWVLVRAEGTTVIVETGDTWTLLPKGSFSRKAGVLTYSIGVEESNLLGTGRSLGFNYDKGTQRIERSLAFVDPNFLLPYARLELSASDLSDGKAWSANFSRPFFALDNLRAGNIGYQQARFETTVYAGGEEQARYHELFRDFQAGMGFRVKYSGDRVTRLLGSVEWQDTELTQGSLGPPPPPEPRRRFLFIGAALDSEGRSWIQRTNAEQMDRVEDFNLAPGGQIELGFSPAVLTATAAGRARARGSLGGVFPSGFWVANVTGETLYQDGPRNAIVTADAKGFLLRGLTTLVAHFGVASGWHLDSERQIYLDGERGVRGYRLHAVSGTGRFVMNLELRQEFFPDVLNLVSFGAAAFIDSGLAWGPPDGSWTLADAGLGLRFGLSRAAKNTILRLDVSKAFLPDPLGRAGWLLSFSSGQAF